MESAVGTRIIGTSLGANKLLLSMRCPSSGVISSLKLIVFGVSAVNAMFYFKIDNVSYSSFAVVTNSNLVSVPVTGMENIIVTEMQTVELYCSSVTTGPRLRDLMVDVKIT